MDQTSDSVIFLCVFCESIK